MREHDVRAQHPRIPPPQDRRALDNMRREDLHIVRARILQELPVRLHGPVRDHVVRQAERDAAVRAEVAAASAPLGELFALPGGGLGFVRELERDERRGLALARGRPDDARAGLDRRVERGGGVGRRERGVVVVEDGRYAVVEGVEASGEGADADLCGCESTLCRPGYLR